MSTQTRVFVGLDLGQAQEATALEVLERPLMPPGTHSAQRWPPYALRHLHGFALGTPYPEVTPALASPDGQLRGFPPPPDSTPRPRPGSSSKRRRSARK